MAEMKWFVCVKLGHVGVYLCHDEKHLTTSHFVVKKNNYAKILLFFWLKETFPLEV